MLLIKNSSATVCMTCISSWNLNMPGKKDVNHELPDQESRTEESIAKVSSRAAAD